MRDGALKGSTPEEIAAFTEQVRDMQRASSAASLALRNTMSKITKMQKALSLSEAIPGELDSKLYQIKQDFTINLF